MVVVFVFVSHLLTFSTRILSGLIPTSVSAMIAPLYTSIIYFAFLLGYIHIPRLQFPRIKLDELMVIAFIMLSFIQVFNPHVTLELGLRGFLRTAFFVGFFFVGRYVFGSRYRINSVFLALALTSALASIYAIGQNLFGINLVSSFDDIIATRYGESVLANRAIRSVGTLGSPFSLGLFAAQGMLAALFCVEVSKGGRQIAMLVCAGLTLIAMIIAGSRSVLLGIMVSMAFLVIIRPPTWLKNGKILLGIIFTTAIASSLFFLYQDLPIVKNALTRLSSISPLALVSGNVLEERNVVARADIWEPLIEAIIAEPLTGYGNGMFGGGSNRDDVSINGVTVADNQYLEIAGELGVIGLLLYLIILLITLQRYLRRWRSPWTHSLSQTLLMMVILFVVAGIGAPPLDAYPANAIFWLFLGIGGNLPKLEFVELEIKRTRNRQRLPVIQTSLETV
jgi:O-antigen ligase